MKINQLSSVNANMHFTKSCALKQQRYNKTNSTTFKGSVAETTANVLVGSALILAAGLYNGASKLFSSNSQDETKHEDDKEYNEYLVVWRGGDSTY